MSEFQVRIDNVTVNGNVNSDSTTPATPAAEVDTSMWPMVSMRATGGYDTPGSIRVQPGTTVGEARAMYNNSGSVGEIPSDFRATVDASSAGNGEALQEGNTLEFSSPAKQRGN